jgi:hypothetical protein
MLNIPVCIGTRETENAERLMCLLMNVCLSVQGHVQK